MGFSKGENTMIMELWWKRKENGNGLGKELYGFRTEMENDGHDYPISKIEEAVRGCELYQAAKAEAYTEMEGMEQNAGYLKAEFGRDKEKLTI